jgi:hypothetical protein
MQNISGLANKIRDMLARETTFLIDQISRLQREVDDQTDQSMSRSSTPRHPITTDSFQDLKSPKKVDGLCNLSFPFNDENEEEISFDIKAPGALKVKMRPNINSYNDSSRPMLSVDSKVSKFREKYNSLHKISLDLSSSKSATVSDTTRDIPTMNDSFSNGDAKTGNLESPRKNSKFRGKLQAARDEHFFVDDI